MPIEDPNAMIRLGYIEAHDCRLDVSLKLNPDHTVNLILFMCDETSRRTGECMVLGFSGATELKQLIDHASSTVGQMVAAGQIAGLARDRW